MLSLRQRRELQAGTEGRREVTARCTCGWQYPEAPAREADGALRAHVLACGGLGVLLRKRETGSSEVVLEFRRVGQRVEVGKC